MACGVRHYRLTFVECKYPRGRCSCFFFRRTTEGTCCGRTIFEGAGKLVFSVELRVSVCFIRYSGEKTRDNPEVPYVLRTGVKTKHHTPIAFSSVLCSFLLPHHVARRERPESLGGAYRKRRGVMSTPTLAAEQLKARLLRAFPTSVSPHTQPRMAMKRNAI